MKKITNKTILRQGKRLIVKLLIILAFLIAFIEGLLELFTFTLYSRLSRKVGIKDMIGYKLLIWTQYKFDNENN